jgi:hypothetical protein
VTVEVTVRAFLGAKGPVNVEGAGHTVDLVSLLGVDNVKALFLNGQTLDPV